MTFKLFERKKKRSVAVFKRLHNAEHFATLVFSEINFLNNDYVHTLLRNKRIYRINICVNFEG